MIEPWSESVNEGVLREVDNGNERRSTEDAIHKSLRANPNCELL